MAEFNFILSPDDQLALTNFLLTSGGCLVPHIPYLAPTVTSIMDGAMLQTLVQDGILSGPVFVSWADYEFFPYEFYKIEHKFGTRYYLKQKHAGPYLDYLPCRINQRGSERTITSGLVAYYQSYWVENIGKEVPVCQELKQRYRIVTTFIRSISKRAYAGNRTYWVGNHARLILMTGYRAAVEGLVLP